MKSQRGAKMRLSLTSESTTARSESTLSQRNFEIKDVPGQEFEAVIKLSPEERNACFSRHSLL